MDIRNFFGKKPAAKKKPAAAAATTTSGSSPKKSKSPASEPAFTKRKRPEVEEKEIEISPQDFFAQSSSSKPKVSKPPTEKAAEPAPKDTPLRLSPRKKAKRRTIIDDDSDNDDEDFVDTKFENDNDETDEEFMVQPAKKVKTPPRTPPAAKKRPVSSPTASTAPSTPTTSAKKRKAPTPKKKATPEKPTVHLVDPGPELEKSGFDEDAIQVSECMAGLTFVFTGNMTDLNRDDALELVKTLGGRVTTAVSGKTNYLVVGPVLEDGRDYKEGSKYKKAQSYDGKVKLVMGENQLYGLCHYYHDRAMKEKGIAPKPKTVAPPPAPRPAPSNPYAKKPAASISNPYAKKAPVSNPYARKAPVNPYAKKAPTNPYAKKAPSNNPYAKSAASSSNASAPKPSNDGSMLWVDRHKPTHTREILGNATNVKKLQDWLRTWERTFNNAKAANRTFSNPRGPWKAALLSGPPGIGSK